MTDLRRISVVFWVAAGFLALIALVLIVPSVWQLITASGGARSSSNLVLALPLLLGAVVFAGVALWLRGFKSAAHGKAIPEDNPAHIVQDLAEGRVDWKTARQAMMRQAPPSATEAAAGAGSPDHPDGERVTVEHFKGGSRVTRSVVKVKGDMPPDSDMEALTGIPVASTRRESAPPNVLAGNDLTIKLARVNRLDLDALTTNRDGRLSPKQIGAILGSLVLELLFYVGIIGFVIAVIAGFSAPNFRNPAAMVEPCGIVIVLVVLVGLLYYFGRRVGADKYDRSPWTMGLVIPDVLLGRVKSVEGMTSAEKQVSYTRNRRQYKEMGVENPTVGEMRGASSARYFYSVLDEMINVGEAGYEAFPKTSIKCRVYYLPLSKMLVNLEVTDSPAS